MLRDGDGLAARVLAELDVKIDDVRTRVSAIVGGGEGAHTGQIPFTPRARRVLELSLREALALGHNSIGTEHLLLGLSRDDNGVASEILRELGTNGDSVHAAVISALGGRPSADVRAGVITAVTGPMWPRQEDVPQRRSFARPLDLVVGWVLFGAALGIGILIGWAIWHH